jgi:mono/diheme cytochrome c family protein
MQRKLAILLGLLSLGLLAAGFRTTATAPGSQGSALLVLSTDCPVAMRYTPRLNALYEAYSSKGISFRAVFPNDLETRAGVEKYRSERGYAFPCELDPGAEIARRERVTILPAILIFDGQGRKVYQGPIDDNKDVGSVKHKYAQEALEAVLAGRAPRVARAEAFGCVLMPGKAVPDADAVNYAEHVAPILFEHCGDCHRPNEVAPFSLLDYESSRKWAPMIEQVIAAKRMPPWKAVEGFGEFRDANVLSEAKIETIKRWVKAGAPKGDESRIPEPPKAQSEWPLGQPDLILAPTEAYKLEAEGDDVYRHYALKTNFKEPRYVKAMAVKPGNPRVVHHVIAFLDERGVSHERDGKDGQVGYSTNGSGPGFLPDGSFGGWAPGLRPQMSPEGVAFELKPGATVVLQVHYHKSGKPETDLTRVGLYFAKEPVEKIMELAWLAYPFFRIPAGAEKHPVRFDFPIPADVTVYSVMPHMHLLGRSMKAQVIKPDGGTIPLIHVADWDFNWQLNYMFREPIRIPAGSKVRVEAVYDNSKNNPFNPSDPPRDVTWGEQTTDEMFLLVASYTVDKGRSVRSRRIGFGGG